MEEISYTNTALTGMLEASFVNVKLNTRNQLHDVRRFPIVWTPKLVVLTRHGDIVREMDGFTPPQALMPELVIAQGLAELRLGRPVRARDYFRSVEADFPQAVAGAEAVYWAGVCEFRISGEKAPVFEVWREIVARHPDSPWAAKTTLLPEHSSLRVA
jgi:hypothetical protein